MRSILLLILLLTPQAPLDPVRVSLADAGADRDNQAIRQAVLTELQSLGYVVIAARGVKWRISVSAVPLKGRCAGYAASLLIVDAADKRRRGELSSHAGPGAQSVAKDMVEKLKRDYFTKRQ